ncbi:Gfo/Idh/MocA family protein [Noviherbaspirillum aerium]|uniref:Gfo/Idh/MocA family protein n=1 Tax=Noviherbaspirillum aerium TaxID=2588497 RepID=UPI00124E1DBD|nr:Gfo/Idh/MocA family oxidoreductase [Noviherbaspirillum aerium]
MENGKIGVGIIGVHPDKGWASIAHIPALKSLPDYQITAISHHQLEVAQAAAAKFGIPNAVGSTNELVNHPDVDLVVVTVKVTQHRQLVESAINAGKSVFCEWPLGMNLDDAIAMRDLAKAKEVHTVMGAQTRAAPAFNFVRDLIHDGYVGRVVSSTLVGSGILWGDTLPETYRYTLDPTNGASMINVPFGHSVDAVLYALDSRFGDLVAKQASIRKTVKIIETGDDVPIGIPDQVAVSGLLESGVFMNIHFRGGLSRGTNFRWEVNGTGGDIIVTTSIGYIGDGGFRVEGATGDETLHELKIPTTYAREFDPGISQSMAIAYQRLASDLLNGTHLSPTFDDAVELHRLIDRIERTEKALNNS